MEPKNLAIIFGPSVVRTCNETLETVVKDMKHQCRIVEALVSHVSTIVHSLCLLPIEYRSRSYVIHFYRPFSMNTSSRTEMCQK